MIKLPSMSHRRRRSAQFLRPAPGRRWRGVSSAAASARDGAIRAASGLLGIGYATPYLGLFREEAERCLAFMPAAQGVVKWPSARPTLSALVDEIDLPLTDARSIACCWCTRWKCRTIRRRCCANCGACWPPAAACSRWCRTGAASGRAWTRRRSAMAGRIRARRSPSLLRETWFTPTGWSEALYVPPIGRGWFLRSARRLGAHRRHAARRRSPGVHIVEATKQVYRAIRRGAKRRQLVPAIAPVLAPSPGGV